MPPPGRGGRARGGPRGRIAVRQGSKSTFPKKPAVPEATTDVALMQAYLRARESRLRGDVIDASGGGVLVVLADAPAAVAAWLCGCCGSGTATSGAPLAVEYARNVGECLGALPALGRALDATETLAGLVPEAASARASREAALAEGLEFSRLQDESKTGLGQPRERAAASTRAAASAQPVGAEAASPGADGRIPGVERRPLGAVPPSATQAICHEGGWSSCGVTAALGRGTAFTAEGLASALGVAVPVSGAPQTDARSSACCPHPPPPLAREVMPPRRAEDRLVPGAQAALSQAAAEAAPLEPVASLRPRCAASSKARPSEPSKARAGAVGGLVPLERPTLPRWAKRLPFGRLRAAAAVPGGEAEDGRRRVWLDPAMTSSGALSRRRRARDAAVWCGQERGEEVGDRAPAPLEPPGAAPDRQVLEAWEGLWLAGLCERAGKPLRLRDCRAGASGRELAPPEVRSVLAGHWGRNEARVRAAAECRSWLADRRLLGRDGSDAGVDLLAYAREPGASHAEACVVLCDAGAPSWRETASASRAASASGRQLWLFRGQEGPNVRVEQMSLDAFVAALA